MTQKELAERVGISRQTMNAIENCRHAPTVVVAIRMADVFHASVDQLFNLEYEGKPAQREQAVPVTCERPPATARESITPEVKHMPMDEDEERRNALAALRNIVGP